MRVYRQDIHGGRVKHRLRVQAALLLEFRHICHLQSFARFLPVDSFAIPAIVRARSFHTHPDSAVQNEAVELKSVFALLLALCRTECSFSSQVFAGGGSPKFSKTIYTYKTVEQFEIQADVYRHSDTAAQSRPGARFRAGVGWLPSCSRNAVARNY